MNDVTDAQVLAALQAYYPGIENPAEWAIKAMRAALTAASQAEGRAAEHDRKRLGVLRKSKARSDKTSVIATKDQA